MKIKVAIISSGFHNIKDSIDIVDESFNSSDLIFRTTEIELPEGFKSGRTMYGDSYIMDETKKIYRLYIEGSGHNETGKNTISLREYDSGKIVKSYKY